jgi:hypothetical protein
MGLLSFLQTTSLLLHDLQRDPSRSVLFRWLCNRFHRLFDCIFFLPTRHNRSKWLTDTDLGDLDLECNDFCSEFSVSVHSLV